MTRDQFEILKLVFEDQRNELKYRRTREFQIFTWSASILLAITVMLFVRDFSAEQASKILDPRVRVVISIVVLLVVVFALAWQMYHHRTADDRKKVIVKILQTMGCFTPGALGSRDPILADEAQKWGGRPRTFGPLLWTPSRMSAILVLGIIALISIWL